jgi:hypothetical protein
MRDGKGCFVVKQSTAHAPECAKCYWVDELRRDGTAAPRLKRPDVLQAVPLFAKTLEAQRWIARVPA